MAKIFLITFLLLSLNINKAKALTAEEFAQELALEEENYYANVDPVKIKKGSIPWEVFASTTASTKCSTDNEGFDYCVQKPIYSTKIKALDHKLIQITGYMFPLEPSNKQHKFLMGAYPISCPFHYHSNPNQVIEVISKKGINFSYDPITIKGSLELISDDDNGSFYQLILSN